ncbi:MAG: hypothetical protein GF397_06710, partial [Elusimicrobia bacterium]|nr:hypothetical protein [Elusimicrobiota bacterium]
VAHCAGHEKTARKQNAWEKLSDKIEKLIKVSEDLGDGQSLNIIAPKKISSKHYIFDVWIQQMGAGRDIEQQVRRTIQIPGAKTLYFFARTITKAFGFYFDHCFGFYDNLANIRDSTKAYELFVDIGEEPLSTHTRGVQNTKISEAFKMPGDKKLFLFDYGDNWHFIIELKEIIPQGKEKFKTTVLKSIGKAPPQYPPCE